MQRLLLILILVFSVTGVRAGPNEGVILAVHGAGAIDETFCLVPETCEELDPDAEVDAIGVEWYYAVVASPPSNSTNFQSVSFGIGDYDPIACYVAFYGPCPRDIGALEVPMESWPQPNTGTMVTWFPHCFTETVQAVYYFGFYIYDGGGPVPLRGHPDGETGVASCGEPAEIDPFEGFGVMGCGLADGSNPQCPPGPTATHELTWGRIKGMYR